MASLLHSKRLAAAARRQQILGAADVLFVSQGFEAVSMADIAGALGISRPAVYSYFASTEAMLEALLEERLAQLWQRLEVLIPAQSSAAAQSLRSAPGFYAQLFAVLLEQSGTLSLLYCGGGPAFQDRRHAFMSELEGRLELQVPGQHRLPGEAQRRPYQMTVVTHLLSALAFFAVQRQLPDAHRLADTLDHFIQGGLNELTKAELAEAKPV